jgi:membrane protease YdiL (CAAX protease family)
VFFGFMVATDRAFPVDRGEDVFDRAGLILEWADERLQAAAEGAESLPDPPQIWADLTALKVGFATTLVYEVSLVALVAIAAKQADFKELKQTFSLNRFSFESLWVPVVAMIVTYVLVIAYQVIVTVLDIDILKPRSNVPDAVTRDQLAMVMAGVLAIVAAPLAEELFFRGFLFRGLLRWGFAPAAMLSAGIFSAAHLSVGAFIPFFLVGFIMAWLYWREGRLWDTIVFHFLFNTTSFVLLAAGAGEGG